MTASSYTDCELSFYFDNNYVAATYNMTATVHVMVNILLSPCMCEMCMERRTCALTTMIDNREHR